jgi:hypothetical protein
MWKPTVVGRLLPGALAAPLLIVSACERKAPPAAPAAAPPAAPAPPAPAAALGRNELLQAMEAAAAAYAAGTPAEEAGLAGRRFVIRQAFGCSGPSAAGGLADGLAHWSVKGRSGDIEITLSPAAWTDSRLVEKAETWEAVEGMWLPRPWLRTEACPPATSPPTPPGTGPATNSATPPVLPLATPQTMGLAAVFEAEGSRVGRRNGRPYSFTIRGKDGAPAPAPADGYRLVLEGRLAGFADGNAIRCHALSPDHRPVCIAASRLDRVAFEDAGGGLLSEWRAG